MNDQQLLRLAAARLRMCAIESVSAGPWDLDTPDGKVLVTRRRGQLVAALARPNDARYIETMHPPVALALADHLDRLSVDRAPHPAVFASAVRLARAIMRRDPDPIPTSNGGTT